MPKIFLSKDYPFEIRSNDYEGTPTGISINLHKRKLTLEQQHKISLILLMNMHLIDAILNEKESLEGY